MKRKVFAFALFYIPKDTIQCVSFGASGQGADKCLGDSDYWIDTCQFINVLLF